MSWPSISAWPIYEVELSNMVGFVGHVCHGCHGQNTFFFFPADLPPQKGCHFVFFLFNRMLCKVCFGLVCSLKNISVDSNQILSLNMCDHLLFDHGTCEIAGKICHFPDILWSTAREVLTTCGWRVQPSTCGEALPPRPWKFQNS